jgi:superfamily II DNA or RNA helicase
MEKVTIEKLNEVYFRVTNLSQSQSMELKSFLSCKMDNYWFHPKYKLGWDGTVYFYKPTEGTIPIGLYPQIVKFCKIYDYQLEIDFDPTEMYNEITDDEFEKFYDVIFKDSSYSPRDYQDEAIKLALRKKRGIIEAATGSGKSILAYSIIRFLLGIDKKILLIVPNVSLVNQMFSDMKDYGWENCEEFCSFVYSGSKKINWSRPIVVSTWQSIVKKDLSFFENFDAVICDEVHLASGTSIKTCLSKCINAEYRIGLTGTIPESLMNQFTIFGYVGPKIFGLASSTLIDKGVLSKIKIANILLEYPAEEIHRYWHDPEGHIVGKDYNTELAMIYEAPWRNKVFKYIIDKLDKNDNILILCNRIEQMKGMKQYLETNCDFNVVEYYGQTKADDRESIRKMANLEGHNIIIGTFQALSQGINIKRLHHIIFASSTRSLVRTLQSIGRGLRKHESKDKLIVWDLVDDLSWEHVWSDKSVMHYNHVYKHWIQRLEYYKNQGFNYLSKRINIST